VEQQAGAPTAATASDHLGAYRDADGNCLDGANTYRLRVPPGVPVKDFWSLVAYDPATRSLLRTGQQFPAVGSNTHPKANPDGSVDVFFAPTAPDGADYWIQTVPGKGWFVVFRFYGPSRHSPTTPGNPPTSN
jgi:hypothetical protein